MQYLELRNYGFNHIIRKYARFPWYLPLPVHMEHGWSGFSEALKTDLLTDKPLMLVLNSRRSKLWRKKSQIPVAIMGSPFIHYKNMMALKPKKQRSGTVAFPSHSTFDIKANFKIEDYCENLKKLPKKYQPVTVCLFWLDYISPSKNIYRKAGLKVVSAGPKFTNSLSFVKNFYKILSKHKFATSNKIGSYTFYAIDFKTPFFLYGQEPTTINIKDVNVEAENKNKPSKISLEAKKLFSGGPADKISLKQSRFVEKEMGLKDCLSRGEMNKLIWKYYENYKKNFPAFFFSFLIATLIFNGPLINLLIRLRRRKK